MRKKKMSRLVGIAFGGKTKIIIFLVAGFFLFTCGFFSVKAQTGESEGVGDSSYSLDSAMNPDSDTYYESKLSTYDTTASESDAYFESGAGYTDNSNSTLGEDEEWDCSEYPGTYADANGNCIETTGNEGSYVDTNTSVADCISSCQKGGNTETDCYSECNSAAATSGKTSKALTVTNSATGTTTTVPSGSSYKVNSDGTITYYNSDGTAVTATASSETPSGITYTGTTYSGTGTTYNYSTGTTGSYLSGVAGTTGCGANFTNIGGVCFPTNTGLSSAPIATILSNVLAWLMILFTGFAIMAFLISGIQYLVSAGNMDQIETAKRNAMYALLGVIVGLSGFVIIQAIASALSGASYFF
jgi:hypothetical protein